MTATDQYVLKVLARIADGTPPQKAFGFTEEQIDEFYEKATFYYKSGKFEKAFGIFSLLIFMDSKRWDYYFCLAACCHQMYHYEDALKFYLMAAVLNPDSPLSFFYASECCFRIGDVISGKSFLNMTISFAGEKPEFTTLKERARLILERSELKYPKLKTILRK